MLVNLPSCVVVGAVLVLSLAAIPSSANRLADGPDTPCTLGDSSACSTGNGFGEPCVSDIDCNQEKYLYCNDVGEERMCGCDVNAKYSETAETCQLFNGETCQLDSENPQAQSCIENSACDPSKKTCKCVKTFIPSLDKKECVPSFDAPCKYHDDCSQAQPSYLVCSKEKVCICGYYFSWFNPRTQRCERYIGEPCSDGEFAEPCTEYGVCDDFTHECTCADGFTLTQDLQCVHDSCERPLKTGQESFLVRQCVEQCRRN